MIGILALFTPLSGACSDIIMNVNYDFPSRSEKDHLMINHTKMHNCIILAVNTKVNLNLPVSKFLIFGDHMLPSGLHHKL